MAQNTATIYVFYIGTGHGQSAHIRRSGYYFNRGYSTKVPKSFGEKLVKEKGFAVGNKETEWASDENPVEMTEAGAAFLEGLKPEEIDAAVEPKAKPEAEAKPKVDTQEPQKPSTSSAKK